MSDTAAETATKKAARHLDKALSVLKTTIMEMEGGGARDITSPELRSIRRLYKAVSTAYWVWVGMENEK